MSKEHKDWEKASDAWKRAMRYCRTIQDKIEAMNDKMAKGLPPKEQEKVLAVLQKLNKDLMAAGKKEVALHQQMEKALKALS